VKRTRRGRADGDNKDFRVNLPNRESFSPDAAAYNTDPTPGMKFLEGAPDFTAEVRSEGDYGPAAEQAQAEKRRDYFAAGTQVLWDVDLLDPDAVVRVYHAPDSDNPTSYRRGQNAEPEPAIPVWNLAVDDLFDTNE